MKPYMGFLLAYLHLILVYLKVKVKLIDISTVNISKMVKNMANISITIKYEVAYRLSIRLFAFDLGHSEGHCQGCAHFN